MIFSPDILPYITPLPDNRPTVAFKRTHFPASHRVGVCRFPRKRPRQIDRGPTRHSFVVFDFKSILSPVPVRDLVERKIDQFTAAAISEAINTPMPFDFVAATPIPVVEKKTLLQRLRVVGGKGYCWSLLPSDIRPPAPLDAVPISKLLELLDADPKFQRALNQKLPFGQPWFVVAEPDENGFHIHQVVWQTRRGLSSPVAPELADKMMPLADFVDILRNAAAEDAFVGTNRDPSAQIAPALAEYIANKELVPAIEEASKMAWHWTKQYFDDLKDIVVHRPHPGDHVDPLPSIPELPVDTMPGPWVPPNPGNVEHFPVVGPEPIDMMPGPVDVGVPNLEHMPTIEPETMLGSSVEIPAPIDFVHDLLQAVSDVPDLLSPFFSELGDEAAYLAEYLSAFSSDLASLCSDLFSAGLHAHEVAAPCFRLINMYLADRVERHGANFTFTTQRRFYLLAALTTQLAGRDYALLPAAATNANSFAVEVPDRYIKLLERANKMDESTASAQTVANEIRRKLITAVNDLNTLQTFYLDPTVDDGQLEALQESAPEFNFCRGVTTSPHSLLQVLRNVFRRRVVEAAGHIRLPIALIGASAPEIAYFAGRVPVLHNCGPILTGRDEYRHNHAHGDVSQTHGRFSQDHRFERCSFVDDDYASYAVVSLFSSHDTDVATFIKSMTRKNARTAYVALHLPVPMLDERIREFTDTLTGLRFVKRADKIDVYHTMSGSAGYSHDANALLSWIRPWATAPGIHVTIETIAQFGSAHLFCVQVGVGGQETVPVVRRTMLEDFYILPSLYDDTLVDDERRFFPMPAKRFEQLVAFVRTSEQSERTLENVSNKLRGQMAMIKVGKNVIEPRLDLDLEQMTSVAYHALIAEELTRRSAQVMFGKARSYYRRMLRRNSFNIIVRFLTYHADNYFLQLNNSKTYLDHSAIERFQRWFFSARTDNSETYNPYSRANDYYVLVKAADAEPALLTAHKRFIHYVRMSKASTKRKFDACRNIIAAIKPFGHPPREHRKVERQEPCLRRPPLILKESPRKSSLKIQDFSMPSGGNLVEVPVLSDLDKMFVADAFEFGGLYADFATDSVETIDRVVGLSCCACNLPIRYTDVEYTPDGWRDFSGANKSDTELLCRVCVQSIFWDDCAGCLLNTQELGYVEQKRGLYCRRCYRNDFKRYDVRITKPRPDTLLELIRRPLDDYEQDPRTKVDDVNVLGAAPGEPVRVNGLLVKPDSDVPDEKSSYADDTGSEGVVNVDYGPDLVLPLVDDRPAAGVSVVKVPIELHPVKRKMDFEGNLRDNIPGHPDDTEFCRRIVVERPFIDGWDTVKCPSIGGAALISEWYHTEFKLHGSYRPIDSDFVSRGFNALQLPQHMLSTLTTAYEDQLKNGRDRNNSWNAVYAKHPMICNAFRCLYHARLGSNKDGIATFDMLTLDGPPMCAKSTLVRAFLKRERLRFNVVVPSKALRDDWIDKLKSDNRHVFTRHGVSNSPVDVLVIDEIFNFDPIELEAIIRARCSPVRPLRVICLGDTFQNTGTETAVTRFDLMMRQSVFLTMRTSLGLPTDALYLYLRANGLSLDHYETTGRDEPSIFFTPPDLPCPVPPDLPLVLYQEVTGFDRQHNVVRDSVRSVAQAQGKRSSFSLLGGMLSSKVLEWITVRPGRMSVAYTRHNGTMWIPIDDRHIRSILPAGVAVEPYRFVCGAISGFKDRLIVPFARDILLSEPKLKDKAKAPRILADLPGMNSVVKGVDPDRDPPVDHKPALNSVINYREIQGHIFERVEDLAPITERLDVILPEGGIRKLRRPELPEDKKLRNGFSDVTGLAAIQSASDEFRSLRDMCDRQFSQSHPVKNMGKGIAEGVRLYERFKQCYYSDEGKIFVDWEADTSWFNTRLTAFLDRLGHSDPLYSTADTVTMESFRKSQSKVKPIPDFAASDPYGQQIIAAPPAFTARFAPACQKMQVNLPRIMRNDMIPDFGMSDDDLSAVIRKRGLEHIFNEDHTQFDLSKQDSTHSLPMLYCFILIALDCGVPEKVMLEYLHACSSYYVRAQFSDLFAGTISFNLGSGDPFTLIRNCVMMLTAIANTFHDADIAQGVQKGDDWTGHLPSFRLHVNANLRSMQIINWKPALTALSVAGTAPYHAGRFWIGHRFVADPVRVFYKHLTRLRDTNVPVRELYNSFISRAVDYSPHEAHVLETVVCTIYDDMTPEQAQLIICVVSAMNRFKFFSALISGLNDFTGKVIDTSDCIFDCLSAVRPDLPEHVRASFRNLPLRTLVKRLKSYGVVYEVVESFPRSMRKGVIYLTYSHAVVRIL
jgi:hypothetical protein